jgi:hypothetical protein
VHQPRNVAPLHHRGAPAQRAVSSDHEPFFDFVDHDFNVTVDFFEVLGRDFDVVTENFEILARPEEVPGLFVP